jgi:hypothetical protein
MFETLKRVLDHKGKGAKAVIWAHNSHVRTNFLLPLPCNAVSGLLLFLNSMLLICS